MDFKVDFYIVYICIYKLIHLNFRSRYHYETVCKKGVCHDQR